MVADVLDPRGIQIGGDILQARAGETSSPPPRTVLELGSGGGNSAYHLKSRFEMTLVDLSPNMLAVSRALNPECEHVQGDIRTVRLGRTFDAVFVHDAICHMTTESDLRAALKTAFVHCRPGGAALFVARLRARNLFREPRSGRQRHRTRQRPFPAVDHRPDPNRHHLLRRLCDSHSRSRGRDARRARSPSLRPLLSR